MSICHRPTIVIQKKLLRKSFGTLLIACCGKSHACYVLASHLSLFPLFLCLPLPVYITNAYGIVGVRCISGGTPRPDKSLRQARPTLVFPNTPSSCRPPWRALSVAPCAQISPIGTASTHVSECGSWKGCRSFVRRSTWICQRSPGWIRRSPERSGKWGSAWPDFQCSVICFRSSPRLFRVCPPLHQICAEGPRIIPWLPRRFQGDLLGEAGEDRFVWLRLLWRLPPRLDSPSCCSCRF